jgi:hypothetical protein
MTQLDDRTMANLDVVLEKVCRVLPHGGNHELRKAIAEKLLDSALKGNKTIGGLTEVARSALAETHPDAAGRAQNFTP